MNTLNPKVKILIFTQVKNGAMGGGEFSDGAWALLVLGFLYLSQETTVCSGVGDTQK